MNKIYKNAAGHTRIKHRLVDSANPIEWPQLSTTQQAEKLRYLECPNYSSCLNYAAGLHWEGFVCIECQIYKQKEKGNEKI